MMKLCRYDEDRLGVVRGDMMHDVTEAQSQIRAAAPYAMKGDAAIAALPAWRSRLEEMAAKAPGKPISQVRLLAPVARPSELVAAPTNYHAHIEEMAARAAAQNIKPSPRHRHGRPVPKGKLVPRRPLRGRGHPLPRAP
jgi:2-keto-4-pentenoate hydratase/2-oxohepta-3-ene-1,7-dioic acid hydratase in catechol pathway